MTSDFCLHLSRHVSVVFVQDAICDSLREYNKHIDSLKDEMQEATESAQNIRADIQQFKSK